VLSPKEKEMAEGLLSGDFAAGMALVDSLLESGDHRGPALFSAIGKIVGQVLEIDEVDADLDSFGAQEGRHAAWEWAWDEFRRQVQSMFWVDLNPPSMIIRAQKIISDLNSGRLEPVVSK
jgi:hypothetical protein